MPIARPSRSFLLLLSMSAACGPSSDRPAVEPTFSLPPATIDVACPAGSQGVAKCSLSDADRLDVRIQVSHELQRLDSDFSAAWAAQPLRLGRQIWFSWRMRIDLIFRNLDAPSGLSAPHAYQLINEDVERRLPSLDDEALQQMLASLKGTTRAMLERSIVDWDAELKRANEWKASQRKAQGR